MKYFRFLPKAVVIMVLAVTSCKKDTEVVPDLSGVEDQFKEYVLRFAAEAKVRNVSVDLNRLKIQAVSSRITMGASSYCGYTFSVLPADVSIQIADLTGCWTNQTDVNKEILIFHELGHGLLKRSHLDTGFPNGMWKSMMHSGNQFNMYSQFNPALRAYYLDELFNVNTPTPSFGQVRSNMKVIFQDSVAATTDWQFIKNDATVNHTGNVSSTVFLSSHHSLAIEAQPGAASGLFSAFFKTLSPTGVMGGSEFVFKARIKTLNLTGTAVMVARVDFQNQVAAVSSTNGVIDISGTKDFTEYVLKIPYFPEKAETINLYLLLTGPSGGNVYFDDIQVISNF